MRDDRAFYADIYTPHTLHLLSSFDFYQRATGLRVAIDKITNGHSIYRQCLAHCGEVAGLVWACRRTRMMFQSNQHPVMVLTDCSATRGIVNATVTLLKRRDSKSCPLEHLRQANITSRLTAYIYQVMVDPNVKRKSHWVTTMTAGLSEDASEQEVHDKTVLCYMRAAMVR